MIFKSKKLFFLLIFILYSNISTINNEIIDEDYASKSYQKPLIQKINETFQSDQIDVEEFNESNEDNPILELKKLWKRLQNDILIKKRSVENVKDTIDDGKKNKIQTFQQIDRNLSESIKTNDENNEYSSMGEFPNDFMTDNFRENGGFIVHITIFLYLSLVLAFICDKYFLKSLEYICEVLSLPSDIAGATFMAIGTSAPELFTSIIGVFVSDNDIGTGTIVGSAVFNLLVIPGACGIAAYKNLSTQPKISSFPIMRDSIFYILTVVTLILCLKDNRIDWVESTALLGLYGVYIVVMYFNAQILKNVSDKKQYTPIVNGGRVNSKRKICQQCNREKRSLESISSTISNFDADADYKVQTKTSNESSPLLGRNGLNCRHVKNGSISLFPVYESNGQTNQIDLPRSNDNGCENDIDYSRIRLEQTIDGKFTEICPSRSDSGANSPSNSQNSHNTESMNMKLNLESLDNQNEIDSNWTDNLLLKIILFPFQLLFWVTLPRPSQYTFVLTFICSVVWIAVLSYVIVWMVTILGITFAIPDTVAGITILAAGTSIPELISSYILVKKSGLVDMALCNSIGSNIFDILFCLGLPWLLRTMVTILSTGFGLASIASTSIPIRSNALPFTSLTLLLTSFLMIIIFKITNWRLGLSTFVYCFSVYILFVTITTFLEFTV